MSEIGILEAKTRLSSYVDKALAGEEVILTRHGKRLVKLVPVQAEAERGVRMAALVERIERRRALMLRRKEPSARALIAEGRKW